LYIFDCGLIHIPDVGLFGFKPGEVATPDMSVGCFFVVHPKGTLMWDVGVVPDSEWVPTGAVVHYPLLLADGKTRDIDLLKTLKAQLQEIGFAADDISYLALSHYHYDHTANANYFDKSTWLVRQSERDAMFAERPPGRTRPLTYSSLKSAKTVILNSDDFDVFGDGTVVIRSAPGHTPGHQVLLLTLAHSGRVMLSGDLYHYPEERSSDRVPTFEFDAAETRVSRHEIEAYLRTSGAKLWIQHDSHAFASLKKSPDFYD
jgi:glyoxylase-like metal-dependent hydrolase (beta-lactamase superfamily II)